MSTPTLVLDTPVSASPTTYLAPRGRRSLSPTEMLRLAMLDCDEWAVELEYADSKGKRTRRTVSPIRFPTPERFLGLCLCREEPRQFYLNRCSNFRLVRSADLVMPVEMVELGSPEI